MTRQEELPFELSRAVVAVLPAGMNYVVVAHAPDRDGAVYYVGSNVGEPRDVVEILAGAIRTVENKGIKEVG
jgi:hypothetical protein